VFSLENKELEEVVASAYNSNAAFFDTAESKFGRVHFQIVYPPSCFLLIIENLVFFLFTHHQDMDRI
jgi:hypothetical protein